MSNLQDPLGALGLTILIEFAVLALVQRRDFRRIVLAAILVNAATEPMASVLYQNGVAPWLVLEVAVFLIEAPLYHLLLSVGWGRAFVLSFLANGASALVGVVLYGT